MLSERIESVLRDISKNEGCYGLGWLGAREILSEIDHLRSERDRYERVILQWLDHDCTEDGDCTPCTDLCAALGTKTEEVDAVRKRLEKQSSERDSNV